MKRETTLREKNVVQQQLGGFLNIDKPAAWTSHDVVAKIRSLLGIKKVGHLGTLDPQATGVLPICFGKGTKLASFLNNAEKQYEAVLRLGRETETEDGTGKILRETPIPEALKPGAGEPLILKTLSSFVGPYMQKPPMFSAIKINGVPLYKIARKGKVIPRASRPVTIKAISLLGYHGTDIAFRVSCSKGTYIRTLCSDIGEKLKVGGHLLSLRRIRAGIFHLDDSVELESFSARCKQGDWEELAYPLETIVEKLPALWVKAPHVLRMLNGVQIGFSELEKWDTFEKGASLRLLDFKGKLMAVGQALHDSDIVLEGGNQVEAPFKVKTVLSQAGRTPA